MYEDLYSEPSRSFGGVGYTGMWEFMFSDPYAQARCFYGEETFQRILAAEKAERDWREIREKRRIELIDDVAGQLLT